MPKTDANLKEAFAGESQANRKYLAFAKKAEQEGHKQVAKLFRAAAAAETVHALNHLEVMDGVGSTADNLKAAIAGEYAEFNQMYPGFIAEAKTDGNKKASYSFNLANRVEQVHHGLFQTALQAIVSGKAPADKTYYVCQRCGNTLEDATSDSCPVCGALKSEFLKVE